MSIPCYAEFVARGHPDKIADQISDAIVDAFLLEDPEALVGCETLVGMKRIVISGEVFSTANPSIEEIVNKTLEDIGYDQPIPIEVDLHRQTQELHQAIDKHVAGDQVIVYGHATNETPSFMPLPLVIARNVIHYLESLGAPLGLDGKALAVVRNQRLDKLLVSFQHAKEISVEDFRAIITPLLKEFTAQWSHSKTEYLINPLGAFTVGGPYADTGVTGRKQACDSYGPHIPQGGGCFSGKDGSKLDRSAAYQARQIAKHLVSSGFTDQITLSLAYGIGLEEPLALSIPIDIDIAKQYDLTPQGIIENLQLKNPIFSKTAYKGHFGTDDNYPWETNETSR